MVQSSILYFYKGWWALSQAFVTITIGAHAQVMQTKRKNVSWGMNNLCISSQPCSHSLYRKRPTECFSILVLSHVCLMAKVGHFLLCREFWFKNKALKRCNAPSLSNNCSFFARILKKIVARNISLCFFLFIHKFRSYT